MKKFLSLTACILTIFLIAPAYSADVDAKLKIKIAGTSTNNTYFLCVDGVGCVSMFDADHGKTYPLTPGDIHRIFMIDRTNLRSYFQMLPQSCRVNVKENQTLTVTGKVMKDSKNDAYIHGLECSVA